MRICNCFSIKTKLLLLGTAAASVALLLFGLGSFLSTAHFIRIEKLRKLETQAAMLGFNSTAVLTFHDNAAAGKLLDSFRLEPTVDAAFLSDANGKLVASYYKIPSQPLEMPVSLASRHLPPLPPRPGQLREVPASLEPGDRALADGRLEIVLPVSDDGEAVGSICLHANLDDYYERLVAQGKIMVGVMAGALVAALCLSWLLQRSLSVPILRLSQTARQITSSGSYTLRMEHRSNDELGDLYTAFNQMLDTIQGSQNDLRQAHDLLEHRVVERTAQLRQEIDEKEAAQADLVRARDAAEAANRAKSEFLANMSHEIRTPLNGILGFTKLLLQGAGDNDPASRREYLEIIASSAEHQLIVINDILDLSKIESGRMEVETIPCAPHSLVAEVASVLRVRAQEKGLELHIAWDGPIPETITSDPARLRQLFMNLVSNAIKFTEKGSVLVHVSLQREGPRPQLELRVSDTGIGIPADKLSAVFEAFVQGDTSVTRRFGGTGLGLAISRRIANALGGNLTVTSEEGVGSTFTATFDTGPLAGVRLLQSAAEVVTRAPGAAQRGDGNLRGMHILVVEDGDTNRKLIELVLERAGASVVSAENGKIGADLAQRMNFDMILMDMQMPVMDGYTATTLLRQHGVSVPIVALTAHAMRGDEEKCRAAGCSGFLTKPIDPSQLTRAVADILADHAAQSGSRVPSPSLPVPQSAAPAAAGDADPIYCTLPTEDAAFRGIAEEFSARLKEKLQLMRQAAAQGDFTELAHLAHWLRGAGGTAGFAVLTQPAERLEQLAKTQQTAALPAALQDIADLSGRIAVCPPSFPASRAG